MSLERLESQRDRDLSREQLTNCQTAVVLIESDKIHGHGEEVAPHKRCADLLGAKSLAGNHEG
jgi:hypothetical protein